MMKIRYYHPFNGVSTAYEEAVGMDCVPVKITVEFRNNVSTTIERTNILGEKFILKTEGEYSSFGFVDEDLESAKDILRKASPFPAVRVKCDSGVVVEPEGCWIMACANSRISKTSLVLQNGVGIIDPDYRGTIRFNYYNLSPDPDFEWLPVLWKSCGQLIPVPRIVPQLVQVNSPDELSKTERGTGGFGSSIIVEPSSI